MSEFMHTRIVSEYDSGSGKFINRLELGDESTTPDTPVDIRFKEPGHIENVHTIFFKNISSGSNVPRIFGDATNLVFFDNYNATTRAGIPLATLAAGAGGVQNPMTENLDAGGFSITNQSTMKFNTDLANAIIEFDGATDTLQFDTTINRFYFIIASAIKVAVSSTKFYLNIDLDMNGNDIADTNSISLIDNSSYIDVAGGKIDNLYQAHAHNASGIGIYDHNGAWRGVLGTPNYALQCQNKPIDMTNQKIVGLAAATAAGDALRYEQLISVYLPLAGGTMSGDIDMAVGKIDNLNRIDAAGTAGVYIFDSTGAACGEIGTSVSALVADKRVDMNSQKIIGLAAATANGEATRYEQVLLLAGGTMNSEAGINMNQGTLTNVGGLSLYNSSDYIDLNGGDIKDIDRLYAKYSTGVELYDYVNALSVVLGTSSYAVKCYDPIDMNGNDIINVDEIKGNSTTAMHLDLRGDDAHRIYYTGTTDNKMRIRTYSHLVFDINGTVQLMIQNDGIHMQAGKAIESDSGDLELKVPSGSKVKFTAV